MEPPQEPAPETEAGTAEPPAKKVAERGRESPHGHAGDTAAAAGGSIPLRLMGRLPGMAHSVPLEHIPSMLPPGTKFHMPGLQKPPTAEGRRSNPQGDSSMATPRRLDFRRAVLFLWLVAIAGTTLWAPFKSEDGRGHALGPAPRQALLFPKNEDEYHAVALDFQRLFAEWVAISAAGGALLVLTRARNERAT